MFGLVQNKLTSNNKYNYFKINFHFIQKIIIPKSVLASSIYDDKNLSMQYGKSDIGN